MRLYSLAKQLDVESKVLLDICKELGYDIKNQLSSLDPEQIEAVTKRLKQGSKSAPAPATHTPPVLPRDISTKVQTLPKKPTRVTAPEPPAPVTHPTSAPTPRAPEPPVVA